MLRSLWRTVLMAASTLLATTALQAQLDPEARRLFQLGYNQPIEGRGPIAGYGFYYFNQPQFYATNLTLRLAVAPIYLDSELGFGRLFGRNTDFAIGAAGGGFAHSYSEIRRGHYYGEESFTGHGGEISASVYHRFNPDSEVPLSLVVRGTGHHVVYERNDRTASQFEVPDDRTEFRGRLGLRWGGQEPSLTAPLAAELSAWHESQVRLDTGPYGFGDREVEGNAHLFWGRALLKLMFENEHSVELGLTAGTSVNTDRFSAYRLGGLLPFGSEFPLSLPGYYYQELSARRFALLNGQYSFPLTPQKNFRLATFAATGPVDYINGLDQPGHWRSGAGGGITYISPSGSWLVTLLYSHGFRAFRDEDRGANQVGILVQYDLDAKARGRSRFFMPGVGPYRSRGVEQLFRR